MDSNKDEALRCLDIARVLWKGGDCAKALRFIDKSVRLFPTPAAEQLGNEIRESEAEPSGNGTTGSSTGDDSKPTGNSNGNVNEGGRSRTSGSTKTSSSSGQSTSAHSTSSSDFTSQQVDGVKRILKAKDYYDVLGVSKDAKEADFKKAYRKLALQFHPDKNKAPGADEAFKAIGTAFAVLSNEDKRRRYDQFGPEAARGDRPQGHNQHFQMGDDDLTPEELFNIFFGGGFPSGNVRVRRRHNRDHQHNHYHDAGHIFRQPGVHVHQVQGGDLIRFLPMFSLVVMYLLFSIANNFNTAPYSLWYGSDHPGKRFTSTVHPKGIPYFVTPSFDEDYSKESGKLRQIETQVIRDYMDAVLSKCGQEQQQQRHDMEMARWRRSKVEYEVAKERDLPSCTKYRQYQKDINANR